MTFDLVLTSNFRIANNLPTISNGENVSWSVTNVSDDNATELFSFTGFTGFTAVKNTVNISNGNYDIVGSSNVVYTVPGSGSVAVNFASPSISLNTARNSRFHRFSDISVQFDSVAVPEPSSLFYCGLGLVGIAMRRRRR